MSKGQLSDTDVLEYNNNFHVLNSTANGKIEASVGKSLSKMYACHRKMYSKKHHSQTSLKVENIEDFRLDNFQFSIFNYQFILFKGDT